MASYITSDLVMEIMSRVPGKALVRFRSVSKQFRSLLSDPCFLRLHHSRSRDSLYTLKVVDQIQVATPLAPLGPLDLRKLFKINYGFHVTNKASGLVNEFTLEFNGFRIRWLSSHHQLLCVVCKTGIHLCDPLNKELKKLPDSPSSSLCFNRSGECFVSFGFVEATMQYKVVKWPQDLDVNRLVTAYEVLNIDINVEDGRLKVSPWRRMQLQCPYLLQLSSQVHVNGFIYWTTSDFQIVSFSLQDKTFSTLNPKPPCFCLDTQGSRFFTLSGIRENLWMIDYRLPSQIMEIWKMEDGSWNMIHKIDLGGTYPKIDDGKFQMLDIWSDQVLFKQSSTSLLICYDAKTNTLKTEFYYTGYQMCHSTDGLLSLHNIDMSLVSTQH